MADELAKKRIAAFSIAIARALDIAPEDVRTIARAAVVLDLESDNIPFTEAAAIVAAQHESYDGTGFPKGLQGDEIPLGARILRLADALDALLTGRPPLGDNVIPWAEGERRHYRAVSILRAQEEIQRDSGTVFDPKVVKAFLVMPDAIWSDLMQRLESD